MSLKKLSAIRNLVDPLRQWQVTFTISMTPALLLAIGQQKVSGVLNGNFSTIKSDTFELRCTSFSYPTTKMKQSSMVLGGFRRKLTTLQDKSGVWKCTVTEDQNGAVMNTIQSWCDLMHNPMTGVRMPSTLYVSTCVVHIESMEGDRGMYGNRGRSIWLKGFYPIGYNVNTVNPSSSDPVSVDIEFNYDWWSETVTGLSAIGTLF